MRLVVWVALGSCLGGLGCSGSQAAGAGSSGGSRSAGSTGSATGSTGSASAASSSSGNGALVTDIAGNGFAGFADGPAGHFDATEFSSPVGVAVDESGDLYVADTGNNRIRKIDSSGEVTTVAGGSVAGFADGPGTTALFNSPSGVATDAMGNLFVADTANNRIRKVDASGTVATVAGNGIAGEVDGLGGLDGTAEFRGPMGVAVDSSGTVYVADTQNLAIRKIAVSGVVTTLATLDTYPSYYGHPTGVAVDPSGNVDVSVASANLILQIDPAGSVSLLSGSGTAGYSDGAAAAAQFNGPAGLALDRTGNLFVADFNNQRIRKVDPSGDATTLAGGEFRGFADGVGGPDGGTAQFFGPMGVAVDSAGNVYVADFGNNRIRQVNADDVVATRAGDGTNGFADGTVQAPTGAELDDPLGLAVDPSGGIYFADFGNNRIRKLDASGNVTTVVGGPAGFADGPAATAELAYPQGVAVGSSGTLVVADTYNHRIRRIDSSGAVTTLAGNGITGFVDGPGTGDGGAELDTPTGVAVDSAGIIYVADQGNHAIRRIDVSGAVTTVAGNGQAGFVDGPGGPSGTAQFNTPSGLAVDGSGNIAVADTGNQSIRKIDPSGRVTTLAGGSEYEGEGVQGFFDGSGGPDGTAAFSLPYAVAFDGSGDVYVADSANNRIRRIDPFGNVTTLAGNGASGFANGAGGPSGAASLASPHGVAMDAQGNVVVSDSGNNCLRRITLP